MARGAIPVEVPNYRWKIPSGKYENKFIWEFTYRPDKFSTGTVNEMEGDEIYRSSAYYFDIETRMIHIDRSDCERDRFVAACHEWIYRVVIFSENELLFSSLPCIGEEQILLNLTKIAPAG
ncbi:MAG: hypothetical protein LIO79_00905 [Rikenellaceae bacterium]|nr:hypothetical protein [Rikenellaceae bacterium]